MTSTILVVDDMPDNRMLCARSLSGETYILTEASDGEEALSLAIANPPDLILLDVMMPRMDGIECARRLRMHDRTKRIPIILVTACATDRDVVAGLEAGATDYVLKPYSPNVLRARIRAALETKLAHDQLERRNLEILQLTYAMGHDLQTPLASLTGALGTIRRKADTLDPGGDASIWVERAEAATARLTTMLEALVQYTRAEDTPISIGAIDIRVILDEACRRLESVALERRIIVECLGAGHAIADEKLVTTVLTNVLENALRFVPDDGAGLVRAHVVVDEPVVRITIEDNGPGIPTSQLENVFLPLKRATIEGSGSGLGLAVVKRAVERLNGRVRIESDGRSGTAIIIELPCSLEPSEIQAA